jgi:hypothetical protein
MRCSVESTMTGQTESQSLDDIRSNPAWVTYLSPFRFIVPDGEEPWQVSLDEINSNTYDHGRLCRIIDRLPTPLGAGWPMLLCYDGGLAIPRTAAFSNKEDATSFFNRILCNLFLGGVICGAVDARDVVWGQLYMKKMLWPVDLGESIASQLHAQLRTRFGGPLHTIQLANPRTLPLSAFRDALSAGTQITGSVPCLSPKFFLLGVTELRNRNWSSALANLWIVIEQLTDHLWRKVFLENDQLHPTSDIPKRKRALKDDNRTWSTSVKHEVLYQSGLISEETLALIFPARQARNDLVHTGLDVSPDSAISACEGAIRLLQHCSSLQFEVKPDMYRPPDDVLRRGALIPGQPRFADWNTLEDQ